MANHPHCQPREVIASASTLMGEPRADADLRSWPWSSPACAVFLAMAGPAVFALFALGTVEPRWQSGEFSDYAVLVLRNTSYVFSPLLLYSTICLSLAASLPRLHAAIRAAYDRLGPPLAARLRHPLAADLAYLMLKPAEWLAGSLGRRLVPGFDEIAERLY
jgi:hypothetical protein